MLTSLIRLVADYLSDNKTFFKAIVVIAMGLGFTGGLLLYSYCCIIFDK